MTTTTSSTSSSTTSGSSNTSSSTTTGIPSTTCTTTTKRLRMVLKYKRDGPFHRNWRENSNFEGKYLNVALSDPQFYYREVDAHDLNFHMLQ